MLIYNFIGLNLPIIDLILIYKFLKSCDFCEVYRWQLPYLKYKSCKQAGWTIDKYVIDF